MTDKNNEAYRDALLYRLDCEVEGLNRRYRSTSGYIDPQRGERLEEIAKSIRSAWVSPPDINLDEILADEILKESSSLEKAYNKGLRRCICAIKKKMGKKS